MIDLLPDADQQALTDMFDDVLAREAPLARLREGDDAGDRRLLTTLARLGWLGIGVGEDRGGLGLGIVEEVLLMRAAGRHLLGTRLLAALLAADLLKGTRERSPLDALLAGEAGAALVIAGGGDAAFRLDHAAGDLCVAVASDGMAWLCDVDDRDWLPSRSIDDAVRLERGTRMVPAGDATTGRSGRVVLLVSAYMVGLAECARDMAAGYARERQQFGQPIGAFQGIKHRCADMAVGCEAAWALTVFAALAYAGDRADAVFQIEAARIVAGDAATTAARGNIQVHGGIGFTQECNAQWLVKRLQVWSQIGGGTRLHRRRLMREPDPAGMGAE